MKLSDIPTKFPIPFANNAGVGFITPIPQAAQTGGHASLFDGFPPDNFIPVGAGGIPPWGDDVNGILNQVSAWSRWASAGGAIVFDATFSAAIGGYPNGAVVQSAVIQGLQWINLSDDNTTDPDAGGAGWAAAMSVNRARTITTSGVFTIGENDHYIGLDRTSAPAPSSSSLYATPRVGQEFWVEDLTGNFFDYKVTISAPGGHTIAGAPSFVMAENGMSARFKYYGNSRWSLHVS